MSLYIAGVQLACKELRAGRQKHDSGSWRSLCCAKEAESRLVNLLQKLSLQRLYLDCHQAVQLSITQQPLACAASRCCAAQRGRGALHSSAGAAAAHSWLGPAEQRLQAQERAAGARQEWMVSTHTKGVVDGLANYRAGISDWHLEVHNSQHEHASRNSKRTCASCPPHRAGHECQTAQPKGLARLRRQRSLQKRQRNVCANATLALQRPPTHCAMQALAVRAM